MAAFLQDRADDWHLQRHAVEELAHRPRALVEISERECRAAHDDQQHPAVVLHPARHVDDHLRERRQVRAESLEQALELRDHEDQQDDRHDDGHGEHGRRVEQRLLDLLLQGLGLFLVGRDLVEHRLERTGVLAGLDEVHEQVVEVQRMLGERRVQRVAGLDVRLDGQHQLLHRRLVVADADDLERLHHRDAGGQHRGELAAEDRDVFGGDLAFALEELALLADRASRRCPGGAGRRASRSRPWRARGP